MSRKVYAFSILLILAACASDADSVIESSVSTIFTTELNVYISNGQQQCFNSALPINTTKGYLTDAGIAVSAQSCGLLNGVMYSSVCGGSTGQVHVFTIDENNLDKAKDLGFDELSNTPKGIIPVNCNSFKVLSSGSGFEL